MSASSTSLSALWVSPEGIVHQQEVDTQGKRTESTQKLSPFLWIESGATPPPSASTEKLAGDGALNELIHFTSRNDYDTWLKDNRKAYNLEAIKSLEGQHLLKNQLRLFADLNFSDLKRCQCDIETACSVDNGFSSAWRDGDRVLAIGLLFGDHYELLTLSEDSDEAEAELLEQFNEALATHDPDTIEGHNIFKFDLEYLRIRCQKLNVACQWGRFGQKASSHKSRIRIAERMIDFPRCDIPGRTVFDTYLMIQIYDLTARDLSSYGLKDVALQLGVTTEANKRTYLEGHEIAGAFETNREAFLSYLKDDLRETQGVANLLLPTYFAQVKNFPITLQEASLRGTAHKVDAIFLEQYYHNKHSLPMGEHVSRFEGGYTKSFETGVYQEVLHFDVASLYPSLLLLLGRNPKNDSLGIFIKTLQDLRQYRLEYKEKARTADTEALRQEYDARQSSFKILINSFYGYLGFSGARFADGDLAAETTAKGRELLQTLIETFQQEGCTPLEADTDGIYVEASKYYKKPEVLLKKASAVLPEGVDLEHDGTYPAMFCYKAKNYALYDGQRVILRGSALRSRGIEPYLKELSTCLIHYLLGASTESPKTLIDQFRKEIEAKTFPVERLAKSEYLSQNPGVYQKAISEGTKSRRASLEVALRCKKRPQMGEHVTYFITPGDKKRLPDWQQARAIEEYNPETLPYNSEYYLKKIDDWLKRYGEFLESEEPLQGELFG